MDLLFRNVIVDSGQITGLIDFEGNRPDSIDVELDTLFRSVAPGHEIQAIDHCYVGVKSTFRSA